MPLFEEKLISPLAIRFTQEHIRPVFQDGRGLDASVEAIAARPGVGDYDLVLEPPFPCIEVVRWSQRRAGPKDDPDSKDWVTLDNRRLYCLQRAAAAHWPRRVAVAVEVLYAATEGILRKCDSTTAGCSVGIGHSPKALTDRWDWREAVALERPEACSALALIAADAAKMRVEELSDAPAAPSMLDLFLQGADLSAKVSSSKAGLESGSEDSTTLPSSPRSRSGSEHCSAFEVAAAALDEALVGRWQAEQGEAYEITATGPGSWTCRRLDGKGRSQMFPLVYHEPTDAVWWGDLNLCVDASEVRQGPGRAQWYATSDNWRRRPRFLWQRPEVPPAKANGSRRARGKRTEDESTATATGPGPRRPARARRPRAEMC